MSDNRKRAIRRLMAETGLKYTQAMRLHDEQQATASASPSPSETPADHGDEDTKS